MRRTLRELARDVEVTALAPEAAWTAR